MSVFQDVYFYTHLDLFLWFISVIWFTQKNQIELENVNPIPAGVLENQDMLGGVNLTPPLNPMFYVQIWQMIHR